MTANTSAVHHRLDPRRTGYSFYKDQHVLITGGSEGIGLAIMLQLIPHTRRVTIIGRDPLKLAHASRLCKQLSDALPHGNSASLDTVSCDVTDRTQTENLLGPLSVSGDSPTIVINCAGQALPGYFHQQDIEAFDRMMDVNYFGIVNVLRIFVPKMIDVRGGCIVNTSSMAGFIGLFGYTGYCASKFAVLGLSESLMRELEPFNIKVHVLCPPNTKTPGLEAENKIKPKEVLATEEKAATISPEVVAAHLLKSLPSAGHIIVPTFDGRLALLLKRFLPTLLHQFVKRKVEVERIVK